MDFKVKGKSWAGNIYHQFESICQDVDDFMSKDTVKFVENQVQSVGMNMKRLYSNVVQDILPPSEEINVAPKAQEEDCKQVEIRQSIDSSRNSDESFPIEQITQPPKEDPFQEEKTLQSLSKNILEEKITSEGHEQGPITIKGDRMAFDQQKNWNEFSEDEECLSNMSNSGWLFESELTLFEDPNSDENRSLSTPAVSSDDKVNEDNGLSLNPQFPSQVEKDSNLCDGFSNKDEIFDGIKTVPSPKVVFSYFSCNEDDDDEEEETEEEEETQAREQEDEKTEETSDVSCTCSTSPKSSNLLESKDAASYETKTVDLPPAFSIIESNGSSAPTSTLSDNKDHQSEVAIVPSETGNTDESFAGISDLNLETVDLSPDVKHDDKRVNLNCDFDRAASHRKNFRYYKKLIQDAFTSRKRLSKEYEHLAILYGDIDTESRQHFRPSSVPSSPNKYILQETSENEWELL